MSDALKISAEVIEQLKEVRAEMLQSFNDHTAGKTILSAQQSLALRSHVSSLTKIIEPGVKEMWPDFSPAEKAYLEELVINNKRNANNIGVVALGPLALPAVVADQLGAPPEVVGNFIELGFNMTAAAGINKVGLSNLRNGVLEPVPHHSPTARMTVTVPANDIVGRAGPVRLTPEVGGVVSPQAMAQKHVSAAQHLLEDAQPLRTWLSDADLGTLFPIIDKYGGKNALLSADKKSQVESGVSVREWIDAYRQHPHGAKMVIEDAQRFVFRMLEDITSDRVLDPEKLKTVITQMRAGEYVDAHEFAALYYVRHLAHSKFVESRVNDFVAISRIVNIKGENLTVGLRSVQEQAEAESPYGRLSEERNRQPPAAQEPGHER